MSTPVTESNGKDLGLRFALRLFQERPRSVLDVGCGKGLLLDACRKAGVPSVGVEPPKVKLKPLPVVKTNGHSARANQEQIRVELVGAGISRLYGTADVAEARESTTNPSGIYSSKHGRSSINHGTLRGVNGTGHGHGGGSNGRLKGDREVPNCPPNGRRVVEATAYRLPFGRASFDWVTMRHVPHHLEYFEFALREAMRVARTGVLIAEPWYDLSIPSQALGAELEAWRRRQHRRMGRIHHDNMTAGELLASVSNLDHFDVQVQNYLSLRSIPPEELNDHLAEEVRGLGDSDPDRAQLDILREAMEEGEIGCNGSMTVLLRRVRPRER